MVRPPPVPTIATVPGGVERADARRAARRPRRCRRRSRRRVGRRRRRGADLLGDHRAEAAVGVGERPRARRRARPSGSATASTTRQEDLLAEQPARRRGRGCRSRRRRGSGRRTGGVRVTRVPMRGARRRRRRARPRPRRRRSAPRSRCRARAAARRTRSRARSRAEPAAIASAPATSASMPGVRRSPRAARRRPSARGRARRRGTRGSGPRRTAAGSCPRRARRPRRASMPAASSARCAASHARVRVSSSGAQTATWPRPRPAPRRADVGGRSPAASGAAAPTPRSGRRPDASELLVIDAPKRREIRRPSLASWPASTPRPEPPRERASRRPPTVSIAPASHPSGARIAPGRAASAKQGSVAANTMHGREHEARGRRRRRVRACGCTRLAARADPGLRAVHRRPPVRGDRRRAAVGAARRGRRRLARVDGASEIGVPAAHHAADRGRDRARSRS